MVQRWRTTTLYAPGYGLTFEGREKSDEYPGRSFSLNYYFGGLLQQAGGGALALSLALPSRN